MADTKISQLSTVTSFADADLGVFVDDVVGTPVNRSFRFDDLKDYVESQLVGASAINTQDGNYTLVLTDAGKTIYKATGGAGETITIPANASVAYDIGTLIAVDNDGGGDLTIAITTDTLVGTDGTTGSRTLGDNERSVIHKLTATRWRYAASDL